MEGFPAGSIRANIQVRSPRSISSMDFYNSHKVSRWSECRRELLVCSFFFCLAHSPPSRTRNSLSTIARLCSEDRDAVLLECFRDLFAHGRAFAVISLMCSCLSEPWADISIDCAPTRSGTRKHTASGAGLYPETDFHISLFGRLETRPCLQCAMARNRKLRHLGHDRYPRVENTPISLVTISALASHVKYVLHRLVLTSPR